MLNSAAHTDCHFWREHRGLRPQSDVCRIDKQIMNAQNRVVKVIDYWPAAQYAGELKFGELQFPCAVLSDGTRVLTETDFMAGLGMYRSGALSVRRDESAPIPLYLAFKNLLPYVIKHLGDVHIKPQRYRTLSGGVAHGISASIIPRICSVWLDARQAGVLGERQKKIAANAELMLCSLAEVGLIALIDEATGYQGIRPRDTLQRYLEMLVRKDYRLLKNKKPAYASFLPGEIPHPKAPRFG